MIFKLRDFIWYPRRIWKMRRFLEASQWWPPQRRREWVHAALRRTLEHALRNVPYYRRTLGPRASRFDDACRRLDLSRLSMLTRDDIRDHFEDLCADGHADYGTTLSHTSGSTGTAMRFLLDRGANVLEFASLWRVLNWAGYRFGDRYASLHGRVTKNDRLVEYDWRTRCLHLSSFNFKRENIPVYLEALKRFRPVLIKAYPSSMDLFARWVQECRAERGEASPDVGCGMSDVGESHELSAMSYEPNNGEPKARSSSLAHRSKLMAHGSSFTSHIRHPTSDIEHPTSDIPQYCPPAILTSSESLLDHQREAIQAAFPCPIYDFYGQNERACLISTCRHGRYHIHEEYAFVEIVKEDGEPAGPGEIGEVVTTSFHNLAMPLIRYRTRDLAVADGDEPCPCGRTYRTVRRIIGRVEDVVITPDGRHIGRLDAAFKYSQGIRRSQIVQKSASGIEVRIVRGPDYGDRDESRLLRELRGRVGDQIDIRIQYVDEIPAGKNGKHKFVVSITSTHDSASF